MAYSFLDASASVVSADSSIISGSTIRPIVQIGSVLTAVPVSFSGSPSVSGAVTVVGSPSISGQVGASVIGTVPVIQSGTVITSIVSTIPSSVIVGASIFGLAPVNVTNTNINVGGSVVAFQGAGWSGSVAAIVTNTNINVSGSVAAFQAGTQSSSVYGVRNDAVASFLGADLTTRPMSTDSAGRTLMRPFAAEEARIEGYASLVSTSVTTLVAAAGAGLRNYITDFFIANTGATTTLITFKDGAGSILGYTIAPTAGGSNAPGLTTPIRTGVNASFDFQPTSASSILFATVKGFKAP